MKIYIDGYKNLNNFEMEVIENKVNVLFGMSGSGKSSIGEALQKIDLDFNKTIGSENIPIIKVNDSHVIPGVQVFSVSTVNELLLTEEANNIYDVIVDDNSKIKKAEKEYRDKLTSLEKAINSEKNTFTYLKDIADNLGSQLNKQGELKQTAKVVHLEKSITKTRDSRTLKDIQKMEPGKYLWLLQGKQYVYDCRCPYCEKRLSQSRLRKLNKLEAYEEKTLKKVADITTKYPDNFSDFDYTQRKIKELVKQVKTICAACQDYTAVSEQLMGLNNTTITKLDKHHLVLTQELKEYFPSTYHETEKIIKQIDIINRLLEGARISTKKILDKRLVKINKTLGIMSIPYTVEAAYSNGRIQRYTITHRDDLTSNDRRKSMSFGEKNVVALIMFVLKCKSLADDLVIIDDPASSFDDYRRNQIYGFIADELNGHTVLLLSHDSIFAKYALVDTKKSGNVIYIENNKDQIRLKQVSKDDFMDFEAYVKDRIISSIDYYQQIINMRLLFEGSYNSVIYQYLSAIIHMRSKEEIDLLLSQKGLSEKEVFDKIIDKYNWLKGYLVPYSDSIKLTNIHGWALLEKAFIIRECFKQQLKKDGYKKALDDFVHLNRKLKICLNPYSFEFCTSTLRSYLLEKEEDVVQLFNSKKCAL